MKIKLKHSLFCAFSSAALLGCAGGYSANETVAEASAPAAQKVNLSPEAWPAGELDKYLALEGKKWSGNPEGIGAKGAVSGSYHPLAQRAGLEALKQGGTSVDAAMTTALTQIAMGGGAVISYFGIIQMVHYDAATGETVAMNASWDTVENETDPMSIPGGLDASSTAGLFGTVPVDGRSALVGGFMRGVEAAHKRYGKLPFDQLFQPAIHMTEKGFPMTAPLEQYVQLRAEDLKNRPEAFAIFASEDGDLLKQGEMFRQTAVSTTLKAVAANGADYLYTGPWAKKAVAAVQAEGGKMSLKDLETYEVMWSKPLTAKVGEYTVMANAAPSYGGANMIEALQLGIASGLSEEPHWSKSGKSLRKASDITFNNLAAFIPPQFMAQIYPGLDFSIDSRVKADHAKQLWARMEAGAKIGQYADKPNGTGHSDTVVAIDQYGNMTAVTHSINAVVWGKNTLAVDGIFLGDPATSQKQIMAGVTPGDRLPDPIEIGIVFKDGKPMMPFASMSMGLHQQTFQSLMNVMFYGMTPKEAVDAPSFFLPVPSGGDAEKMIPPTWTVQVMKGEFSDEVIEESGLPVKQIKPEERRFAQGLWVGITKDPETGELRAGSHPYTNGRSLAY